MRWIRPWKNTVSTTPQTASTIHMARVCDCISNCPKLRCGIGSQKRTLSNACFTTLDISLRLLHPFMPFVNREIWQKQRGKARISKGMNMKSIMIWNIRKRFSVISGRRRHVLHYMMRYGIRTIRENWIYLLRLNWMLRSKRIPIRRTVLRENVQYVEASQGRWNFIGRIYINRRIRTAVRFHGDYIYLWGRPGYCSEIERLNKI